MNSINEMFKFFIEMLKGVLWHLGETDCILDHVWSQKCREPPVVC